MVHLCSKAKVCRCTSPHLGAFNNPIVVGVYAKPTPCNWMTRSRSENNGHDDAIGSWIPYRWPGPWFLLLPLRVLLFPSKVRCFLSLLPLSAPAESISRRPTGGWVSDPQPFRMFIDSTEQYQPVSSDFKSSTMSSGCVPFSFPAILWSVPEVSLCDGRDNTPSATHPLQKKPPTSFNFAASSSSYSQASLRFPAVGFSHHSRYNLSRTLLSCHSPRFEDTWWLRHRFLFPVDGLSCRSSPTQWPLMGYGISTRGFAGSLLDNRLVIASASSSAASRFAVRV